MPAKNGKTRKLQITIDVATERILGEMVPMGIHGTTKPEVAVSILRDWLWANEEKLRRHGVLLVPRQESPTTPKDGSP